MASHLTAVGLVEVLGLPPAVVVADAMVKAAQVRLISLEVNTLGAMMVKVEGETGAVRAAYEAGVAMAESLGAKVGASLVPHYAEGARGIMIDRCPSVSKLLSSRNQLIPAEAAASSDGEALGFVETRGYLGSVVALDAMSKAAEVRLVAKEKIGQTRSAMLIRGDVAAVRAAVDAGRAAAEAVSTVFSAHVIPRPDAVIMALFEPAPASPG